MEKGSAVLILVAIAAAVLMLGVFALMQRGKQTVELTSTPVPAVVTNNPAPTAGGSTDIDSKLKDLDSDAANIDQALKDQPVDVMSE